MLSCHKHPSDEHYTKWKQGELYLTLGSQDHRGLALPSTSSCQDRVDLQPLSTIGVGHPGRMPTPSIGVWGLT